MVSALGPLNSEWSFNVGPLVLPLASFGLIVRCSSLSSYVTMFSALDPQKPSCFSYFSTWRRVIHRKIRCFLTISSHPACKSAYPGPKSSNPSPKSTYPGPKTSNPSPTRPQKPRNLVPPAPKTSNPSPNRTQPRSLVPKHRSLARNEPPEAI